MKHVIPVLTALTLAVSATAGFAEEGSRDANRLAEYQAHAGAPVKNIAYYNPVGWEVVNDDHILLTMRPKEAYLMRLSGPCLRSNRGAPAISISSTAGRVAAGFDRITVGRDQMACRVEEIRPVDVAAMRKARDAEKASS